MLPPLSQNALVNLTWPYASTTWGTAVALAPVTGSALPTFPASKRTLKYTSLTIDPVVKKRQRRQEKSRAYPPSDPSGCRIRSSAALNQSCTWAPKRNQVYSASLISRAGPICATAGRGVPVGLAGAVSGACGFSVCVPVGADCADAAVAASIAINDAQRALFLAFQILPMSSP